MGQERITSSFASPFSPEISLQAACEAYLERRADKLKPRSHEAYRYHFRTLQKFFNPEMQLSGFHEQHFRDYQKWRAGAKAGPSLINHELGALSQVLELADLWHPISKYYERLPEKNWAPPKVMTHEEEERFIRFARRKPEWRTALNAALITGNTTIAGCGLRTLRLGDLRLMQDPPVIQVPATVKNSNRVRGIPLNEVALTAVRDLVSRAKECGSSEPEHYLIPFRIKKGKYDPTRSASPFFIRSAFRAIAQACGLAWVTPSTFRHQAITKLLESGTPDETVRAIAGHGTEKAMKYYSHIRISAKKEAVDRLNPTSTRSTIKSSLKQTGTLPLLAKVRAAAERLGIEVEKALELVLTYERGKHA
jgi:integrase